MSDLQILSVDYLRGIVVLIYISLWCGMVYEMFLLGRNVVNLVMVLGG